MNSKTQSEVGREVGYLGRSITDEVIYYVISDSSEVLDFKHFGYKRNEAENYAMSVGGKLKYMVVSEGGRLLVKGDIKTKIDRRRGISNDSGFFEELFGGDM